jgi:hypothetical protein
MAQIVPDATLGSEASVVSPGDLANQQLIEGGAARGNALFHSFDQFNVANGERVDFANPNGITNILGRVTGSDISDILGTLGVDGGQVCFCSIPMALCLGRMRGWIFLGRLRHRLQSDSSLPMVANLVRLILRWRRY